MRGQVLDLSLSAQRAPLAAMAFSHDPCTRADSGPSEHFPGSAGLGNPAALPCRTASARVQRVTSGGAAMRFEFLSLQYRPAFVERAAIALGCAGALLIGAVRLAGGA